MESILKVRSALVAFGSNQCRKYATTQQIIMSALANLAQGSTRLAVVSQYYQTPAFPAGSGPDFVNGAARILTTLGPEGLLARLHEVEADFGRERHSRWAARTLDLDLIAFEDEIIPDKRTLAEWIGLPPEQQVKATPDRLLLPHPRVQDRAFVLIPLRDIAATWRHPLTQKTVIEMIADLPEAAKAEIRPI